MHQLRWSQRSSCIKLSSTGRSANWKGRFKMKKTSTCSLRSATTGYACLDLEYVWPHQEKKEADHPRESVLRLPAHRRPVLPPQQADRSQGVSHRLFSVLSWATCWSITRWSSNWQISAWPPSYNFKATGSTLSAELPITLLRRSLCQVWIWVSPGTPTRSTYGAQES